MLNLDEMHTTSHFRVQPGVRIVVFGIENEGKI